MDTRMNCDRNRTSSLISCMGNTFDKNMSIYTLFFLRSVIGDEYNNN